MKSKHSARTGIEAPDFDGAARLLDADEAPLDPAAARRRLEVLAARPIPT
ncbi:MAG: hypothetical protein ABSC25_09705 [Roseiarcus sp.]